MRHNDESTFENCPFCGSNRTEYLGLRQGYEDEVCDMYKCLDCGGAFTGWCDGNGDDPEFMPVNADKDES
jgi:hypothetical protein